MSEHHETYGGLASRWGALAAEIDSDDYDSEEEEYARGGLASGVVPARLRAWTKRVMRERSRLRALAHSEAERKKITLRKVMVSLSRRSKSKMSAEQRAKKAQKAKRAKVLKDIRRRSKSKSRR